MELKIGALEKAATLVVPSSTAGHPTENRMYRAPCQQRRNRDDITLGLVEGLAMSIAAADSQPSTANDVALTEGRPHQPQSIAHSVVTARSTYPRDAFPQGVFATVGGRHAVTPERLVGASQSNGRSVVRQAEDVSSVSSESPRSSTSRSSSSSSTPSASERMHTTVGQDMGLHVNFLVSQMRSALTPAPHLAPPMQSPEYRDMRAWLKQKDTNRLSHVEDHALPSHHTQGIKEAGVEASGIALGQSSPSHVDSDRAAAATNPTGASIVTATIPIVPVPAKVLPPPPASKAAPSPPPKAAAEALAAMINDPPVPPPQPSAPTTSVVDWDCEAKHALASGTWKQAIDKQNRTYYFHTKEKKTCWNLAKELERRNASSSSNALAS
jgi:hypothetical protein